MDEKTLVSVVLPVYNQVNTIRSCLETLIRQTYSQREIIVVDDGSTDGTPDELLDFSRHNPIRIIHIAHLGRSAARNMGVENAQGAIIAFVEGDAEYDPVYLAEGLKFFADPSVGAAYVQHQAFHRKGWIAEAVWLEREMLFQRYEPFSAWFYRKDVFTILGGFDETLETTEDQDLAIRLRKMGWLIGFEPQVLWWHREPDSLIKVMERSFWRGRHKILFYRKYPRTVPTMKLLLTAAGLVSLFFSIIWRPLFFVLFLFLVLLLLGKMLSISKANWSSIDKRYISVIAILSILRNTSSCLGTLLGFLEEH